MLANLEWFKSVRRRIQVDNLPGKERARFYASLRIRDTWRLPEPTPTLGIVFRATADTIGDLPWLITETHKLGARHFLVTNVPPVSKGTAGEAPGDTLYRDRLAISPFPTLWSDRLRLPLMDIDDDTRPALTAAVGSYQAALDRSDTSNVTHRCPFVEAGAMVIDRTGRVSPCLALAHPRDEFAGTAPASVDPSIVGDLAVTPLEEIWKNPSYLAFRRRVQEDCEHGSADPEAPPLCRGCLWSRGLIVCP